jgi:hypothetical protein
MKVTRAVALQKKPQMNVTRALAIPTSSPAARAANPPGDDAGIDVDGDEAKWRRATRCKDDVDDDNDDDDDDDDDDDNDDVVDDDDNEASDWPPGSVAARDSNADTRKRRQPTRRNMCGMYWN